MNFTSAIANVLTMVDKNTKTSKGQVLKGMNVSGRVAAIEVQCVAAKISFIGFVETRCDTAYQTSNDHYNNPEGRWSLK